MNETTLYLRCGSVTGGGIDSRLVLFCLRVCVVRSNSKPTVQLGEIKPWFSSKLVAVLCTVVVHTV